MPGTYAFILKGYPRLSETFIAQEILALEQRGLKIVIVSLRHPSDPHTHPIHAAIRAPVRYLPEYLVREPLRVLRAWRAVRRQPAYGAAWQVWRRDLARDPSPNRVRRFGQALVLAHEMGAAVTHLHAHFLHTPGSVARYTSLLVGVPWSVSAHAKDVWTIPAWEKAEKLTSCAWCAACSALNAGHLAALAPPDRVHLVYHGLDSARFPPNPDPPAARDGSDAADPVRLVSVGRAVPKKGYDDLLTALSRLPAGLHWRFTHVGGGPLLGGLKRRAQRLGLDPHIEWWGAQSHDAVLASYRRADLFVLACRTAPDGDRDGLPNVLVEAQSQGLACVSTASTAIPELIEDGVTGRLVAVGNVDGLAAALGDLIADPSRRRVLGEAGEKRVSDHFDAADGIDRLAGLFGLDGGGAEAEPVARSAVAGAGGA
jgi:glycosyltransferase involved in cell wall biosynthesis